MVYGISWESLKVLSVATLEQLTIKFSTQVLVYVSIKLVFNYRHLKIMGNSTQNIYFRYYWILVYKIYIFNGLLILG